MKSHCLLLICLLGAESATEKKARRHSEKHSIKSRDAALPGVGSGGYKYPVPSTGSVAGSIKIQDGFSFGNVYDSGGSSYDGDFGPLVDLTTGTASGPGLAPPNVDFENLSATLDASIHSNPVSVNQLGPSFSSSGYTTGQVITDDYPNVFQYKPHFGGKDLNNLPHLLPPTGKSIEELQRDADDQLRNLIENAKRSQWDAMENVKKLKGNYGYGTFGYGGFNDKTFSRTENFDLGTYEAKDLGTSIDYNALKGPNGKLKLPVQNVIHTKTVGIKIPHPYPVKEEVAVPAPYPVVHTIAIPPAAPQPPVYLEEDEDLTTNSISNDVSNPQIIGTTGVGGTIITNTGTGLNFYENTGFGNGGGGMITVDIGNKGTHSIASQQIQIGGRGPSTSYAVPSVSSQVQIGSRGPNINYAAPFVSNPQTNYVAPVSSQISITPSVSTQIQVGGNSGYSVPSKHQQSARPQTYITHFGNTGSTHQNNYAIDELFDELKPPASIMLGLTSSGYNVPGGFRDYSNAHDISSEAGELEVPNFATKESYKIQPVAETVDLTNGYRYRRRDQKKQKPK